jgi:hypothetical protein
MGFDAAIFILVPCIFSDGPWMPRLHGKAPARRGGALGNFTPDAPDRDGGTSVMRLMVFR